MHHCDWLGVSGACKAFKCFYWGLRETSDGKVAPTNDGNLGYTDTLRANPPGRGLVHERGGDARGKF